MLYIGMRQALRILGFNECHHMYNIFTGDAEHLDGWVRAIKSKFGPPGSPPFTRDDWDELLANYQAVTDVPGTLFGPELARAYPDAKIVVINRDPEAWHKSVMGSIATQVDVPLLTRVRWGLCALLDPNTRALSRFFKALLQHGLGGMKWHDKPRAMRWFHNLYAEVREEIPENRKLEMTIKDGWGPLCEFLGVDVPTETDPKTGRKTEIPFPRLHDQDEFNRTQAVMRKRMIGRATNNLLYGIGAATVAGAVGLGIYDVLKSGRVERLVEMFQQS